MTKGRDLPAFVAPGWSCPQTVDTWSFVEGKEMTTAKSKPGWVQTSGEASKGAIIFLPGSLSPR